MKGKVQEHSLFSHGSDKKDRHWNKNDKSKRNWKGEKNKGNGNFSISLDEYNDDHDQDDSSNRRK